jgi:hypothetical protein
VTAIECVTCKHINNCATVTPEKILAHYRCNDWEEVGQAAAIQARCDIITKYGVSGLKALISEEDELEDPKEYQP